MRDRRHLTLRYSGRPQVDAAELARWCVLLNYSEGKLAEAESIHQTHPDHWRRKQCSR